MKQNFHWIILYDIRDVKRLSKVAKVVESYGWRVQKSACAKKHRNNRGFSEYQQPCQRCRFQE